jgi:phosphate transport system substrate-binding protein
MSTPDKQMVQKPKSSGAGMWAAVAVVLIVVVLVVVGFEAGWFGKASTTNNNNGNQPLVCNVPSGQTVTGAGSTFVYPLMDVWTTDYTASTITYNPTGSGTGISDLAAKTYDFAASDAPLSPAQQATAPNVVTMPESAGAVAMIYNVPGVPTLKFDGAVLANIYLGTVTSWNDPSIAALNPGVTLPSASIVVVHRSDGSGTTFAFTEYLSAESATWKSTYGYSTANIFPIGSGQPKNGGVASYVQETEYAIGYVDLEYALANGIAYGAVENPNGNFTLPSITSAAAALAAYTGALPAPTDAPAWYNVSMENMPGAAAYPISTFTYLISYADLSGSFGSALSQDQANAMLSFWNWTIHIGQTDSAENYYVPLPASIVTSDQVELAAFSYNSAPVAHC